MKKILAFVCFAAVFIGLRRLGNEPWTHILILMVFLAGFFVPAQPGHGVTLRRTAVLGMIVCVYVLHQDFWNWAKADPLVLGFLPIGLAYHAIYSIWAATLMAVLVTFAWPKRLEDLEK
jgi:hypothetical protein